MCYSFKKMLFIQSTEQQYCVLKFMLNIDEAQNQTSESIACVAVYSNSWSLDGGGFPEFI